ncbi:hypothetical protein ACSBR2_006103 [Camellia fascicularis]
MDPLLGRDCVADPSKLASVDSRIMKRVRDEFGVVGGGGGGIVCLGGFRNVRGVYDWNGLKLEVAQTMYDFGTCYEIECESAYPDKVKNLIEEFLKDNGIHYSYSEASKFAIFRSGKLPRSRLKLNLRMALSSYRGCKMIHSPDLTFVVDNRVDAHEAFSTIIRIAILSLNSKFLMVCGGGSTIRT